MAGFIVYSHRRLHQLPRNGFGAQRYLCNLASPQTRSRLIVMDRTMAEGQREFL